MGGEEEVEGERSKNTGWHIRKLEVRWICWSLAMLFAEGSFGVLRVLRNASRASRNGVDELGLETQLDL
jgi:hypothetical protein